MHEGSEDFSEDQESENDLTWKIKDTEITYRTKSPKTVNQYLLGEVLGKGSYGKVREALDTNTMKTVAIKIITKSQLRKLPGGGEASVRQEIALMKRLKPHPNIVTLIDSFANEEKGKLYPHPTLPQSFISLSSISHLLLHLYPLSSLTCTNL